MSSNTLKVNEWAESADFDDSEPAEFDEKTSIDVVEDDNSADDILLSQDVTQHVLDATQLYLGEIGFSPLLTAQEEVYFARRARYAVTPPRAVG